MKINFILLCICVTFQSIRSEEQTNNVGSGINVPESGNGYYGVEGQEPSNDLSRLVYYQDEKASRRKFKPKPTEPPEQVNKPAEVQTPKPLPIETLPVQTVTTEPAKKPVKRHGKKHRPVKKGGKKSRVKVDKKPANEPSLWKVPSQNRRTKNLGEPVKRHGKKQGEIPSFILNRRVHEKPDRKDKGKGKGKGKGKKGDKKPGKQRNDQNVVLPVIGEGVTAPLDTISS